MVRVFCRVILPACLVMLATLAWALEKRADDDINLELGLAPPAPLARSASAGPSVPMRTPAVPQLLPLRSFPPMSLQAQQAQLHAEYGKLIKLAPSGMSPDRNEEPGTPVRLQESSQGTFLQHSQGRESENFPPDVHYRRPVPPVQVHDVPSSSFPQSSRPAPFARPGREPPARSNVVNVGGEGEGRKSARSKRKGDGVASSSSTFRKKVMGDSRPTRQTPDPRGNLIGPRDIPSSIYTSTSRADPSPQFHQNAGHGSEPFFGAGPMGSQLPQLSRAEALNKWSQYNDVYLDKSLPQTVTQGTFFPKAGLRLQERIDQLIDVKWSLLKHNRVGLTAEEMNTLHRPFNTWRDLDTLSGGYPREATQTISERAQHDQKLLKDVESILRKIVPEI